jgi:Carboxypeptidase regulatory-like domain
MKKVLAGTFVFTAACTLFATAGWCGKYKYTGGAVANGGTISGVVHYAGPPKDISIPVMKEKNGEFCSRHPEAKEGVRVDHKISSSNGLLQNAVVFIEDIRAGKKWGTGSAATDGGPAGFTHFQFRNCEIVPKVTVIRKTHKGEKKGNLTVATHDEGVLHNPIGYLVDGAQRKILFNKPLSAERPFTDATRSLKRLKKKKGTHFLLQCGQHNYIEADARIVWNPYYFVTGADGAYQLEQIPAGRYQVTAWHPYAGTHTRTVTVSAGEAVTSNFEVK